MKAAVYTKYGGPEVLQVTDVPKPDPKANEVLIEVQSTTVTSGDVRLRASDFPPLFWLPARLIFGLFKPKKSILGHEFSGIVTAVGKQVTKFKQGDNVFGTTTMKSSGSYAEFVCLPQEWKQGVLEHAPKGLSHDVIASLPIGGMTALFLLEKGEFAQGKSVLVYGASGSVGSYAVQIAQALGASTITGVCSAANAEMVKTLGADQVIDYKTSDYTDTTDKFDIVFDAVGKTSKTAGKKVLKSNGKYVSVNMLTAEKSESLLQLKELAENGKIKPFIDRTYSLDEIAEAHRYVDSGRKRGSVVIRVKN